MKSIWKGSLSFGLINIPVSVYSASQEHALNFHMLHKKDLSPIRFARICKKEGKEVAYQDIVKGFEYEKDEYIVLEEKDFKVANAKKTSTIEIQQFIDIDAVSPLYFEKPYFLEPDQKLGKAYQLLTTALQQSHKVALVNFVFRNREHLGVVLEDHGALVLIQMRYFSEIRSAEDLYFPHEKITARELEMALKLVEQLSLPFEPEKYHDTYTEDLMEIIEGKLKGKKISSSKSKVTKSYEAKDLMNLLTESMKKNLSENTLHKKYSTHANTKKTTKRKRVS